MSDITKKALFANLGLVGGNAKSLKPSGINHSDISAKPLPAKQLGAPQNNRFLDQTALLNNNANGNLNKAATSFDASPYAHSPYVNNLGFNKDVYSSTPIPSGDVSTKRAEFFDELSSKVMNADAPTAPTTPAPTPAPSPTPEPAPELKAPAPIAPAPTVGNTGSIYDTQKGYDRRVGAHAPAPLPAPAKTFAQEALKPGADIQGLVNRYFVEPQNNKVNYASPDPVAIKAFEDWHSKLPNKKKIDYAKTINDAGAIFDPNHPEYKSIREPYYNKKPTASLPSGYNYMTPRSSSPYKSTPAEVSDAALKRSRTISPEILDYLHGAGLIQKGGLTDKDFSSGFGQSRGISGPEAMTQDSEAFKEGKILAEFQRLNSIAKELQGMPEETRVKALEHMPLHLASGISQVNSALTPSIIQARSGLENKTVGELGTMDSPGASNQSVFHFLADPKSTVPLADRIKTLTPDKQALVKNLPANQYNLIKSYADADQNQSIIDRAKAIAGSDTTKHSPGYWGSGAAGALEQDFGVGAVQPTKNLWDYARAFNPLASNTAKNDINAQRLDDKNNLSIENTQNAQRLLALLSKVNDPKSSYASLTPQQRQAETDRIKGELGGVVNVDNFNRSNISKLDSVTTNPVRDNLNKGNVGGLAMDTLGATYNANPVFNLYNTLAHGTVYANEGNGFVNHDNKDTLAGALGVGLSLSPSILRNQTWKSRLGGLALPAAMSIDPINEARKHYFNPAKPNDPQYVEQKLFNAKSVGELNQVLAQAEKANLLDKDKANTPAVPAVPEVKNPGVTSGMTSLQKGLLAAGIGIPAIMAITSILSSKKKVKPDEEDDEEDDTEDEAAYKRKLRARNANR